MPLTSSLSNLFFRSSSLRNSFLVVSSLFRRSVCDRASKGLTGAGAGTGVALGVPSLVSGTVVSSATTAGIAAVEVLAASGCAGVSVIASTAVVDMVWRCNSRYHLGGVDQKTLPAFSLVDLQHPIIMLARMNLRNILKQSDRLVVKTPTVLRSFHSAGRVRSDALQVVRFSPIVPAVQSLCRCRTGVTLRGQYKMNHWTTGADLKPVSWAMTAPRQFLQ